MSITPARTDHVIEIALVNNMPDQALPATQRQFSDLARAGAQGRNVNLRCYALPNVARSETARRFLSRSHEDIEALYRRGADALIVTGAEPRAARLDEEPYWRDIQRLIDWARDHTLSAIWSCLAAHTAVLHLDGVERRRAERKISGVFSFQTTQHAWSDAPTSAAVVVPHSRYNGLVADDLEQRGYNIASYSPKIGVDVFWRNEPSLFLFLQGHPEYDPDTLLKEYRRDVLRFVSAERDEYPEKPENYFSDRVSKRLDELRARIRKGVERNPAEALAAVLAAEGYGSPWAEDAARLYQEWIRFVSLKAENMREIA